MRKLFLIAMLVAAAATLSAQEILYFPADDSIQADTSYVPSSSGWDMGNKSPAGALSFTFRKVDVADSLSFAGFEYRNETTETWTAYTGNGIVSNTTTDGLSRIYITTPIIDRFIRARLSCASGDTVAVTNQVFMFKEE